MPTQTAWEKTKTGGKAGFDKLWGWADKLGAPVNRWTNKIGSEAFWPTDIAKESDKAARILRSFCKDGFYEDEVKTTDDGPKLKQRVLKKIPTEVIKNAKGLAIFTTMRSGLWISGAGGSGVLVARLPNGEWSPPSGILLHTAGVGFMVGLDIYDCVVVINTEKALEAFTKIRCTLGGEISVAAGPVGAGAVLETELHKRQAPVFTYMKSRGFYAGVQVDGTVIIERGDENEKFYLEKLPVKDILAGKVRHPPYELKTLFATLKAAQGDTVDPKLLPDAPPPGDFEIEESTPFGVPDKEDPDPYGVRALQEQGFIIKEAGTQQRPSAEEFDFNPKPSSPIFATYRRSFDSKSDISRRNSWRTSAMSTYSDRAVQTTDMAVQTDFDSDTKSIRSAHGRKSSTDLNGHHPMTEIPENKATDIAIDTAKPEASSPKTPTAQRNGFVTPPNAEEHLEDHDDEVEEEEPVVQEIHKAAIHKAASPQVISRAGARLVTVTKPTPPRLPPRNPIRDRKKPLSINADAAQDMHDQGTSPMTSISSIERPSLSPGRSSGRSQSEESVSSIEAGDQLEARVKRLSVRDESDLKVIEPEDAVAGANEKEDNDAFYSPSATPGASSPVKEEKPKIGEFTEVKL